MTTGLEDRPAPVVLHVSEAFGGGVMVAIRDYITATRDRYTHYVLAAVRSGIDTGDFEGAELIPLGSGKSGVATIRRIRSVTAQLQPDVIHLHSSWAGIAGRIAARRTDCVVYTPHCYAFERLDVAAPQRSLYRAVEKVLARRTTAVVAVSPRERHLAHRLNPRGIVTYVPNVARIDEASRPASIDRPGLVVVMTGRAVEQKDPRWFAEFATELRKLAPQTSFRWLGAGSAEYEQVLGEAGVEISGWLSRRELLGHLAKADVYVHSAAWEGAPFALLEAAALEIPVIVRDIPAMRSLEIPYRQDSPRSAAAFLFGMVSSGRLASYQREVGRLISERHSFALQRRALIDAYTSAMAAASIPARKPTRPDVSPINCAGYESRPGRR